MFHVTIFNLHSGEDEVHNVDSFDDVVGIIEDHRPMAVNYSFNIFPYFHEEIDIEGLE